MSGYFDYTGTIELGNRPIDICFNWNTTGENISPKSDINTFLNNYKLENLDKQNPDYSKSSIRLIEGQQDVLKCLNTQIDAIKNNTSTPNIIKWVIIQGKAGSGKNKVIKEMVTIITTGFVEDAVKITASTGMAAVNVNGKTFHSLLRLTLNYKQFGTLENQKAKKLQSDLKTLKFFGFLIF